MLLFIFEVTLLSGFSCSPRFQDGLVLHHTSAVHPSGQEVSDLVKFGGKST